MKKTLYFALLVLVIIFLLLLSRFFLKNENLFWSCGDGYTDSRDGNIYSTVEIGDQCWFSQNLAFLPQVFEPANGEASKPYYYVYGYEGNDVKLAKSTNNYETNGVLYNYQASLTACPLGWKVPSDSDWQELETFLGMEEDELDQEDYRESGDVASKLASWTPDGTNSSGFNAIAGGSRCPGAYFDYGEAFALYRSSTILEGETWVRSLSAEFPGVLRAKYAPIYSHSIRCIKM